MLKQMHSTPGAKHPILSLRLRDESQDDFKFIFQTELEKDQMKDIVRSPKLISCALLYLPWRDPHRKEDALTPAFSLPRSFTCYCSPAEFRAVFLARPLLW